MTITISALDPLEVRAPAEREAALFAALPGLIAHAQAHSPAMSERLAGIDPSRITDRATLAALPVLRKYELLEQQKTQRASDVFGGFATIGWRGQPARHGHGQSGGTRRVFQSPGSIYEPEGEALDYWRMARAIRAAGFERGDLIHNSFSYHLTPAGSMMETGAHALGCTVFPGGVGNTELQLQAIQELRPHGYIGTPSFLKILVEKASEAPTGGGGLGQICKALVSGEAFPPSLRDWLIERGVQAYQCYATADVGLIAFETSARQGLVVDEHVILEIVRPGTHNPVPDGEVGEVVVTVLNPDYPLIRFGTGDLSAILPGPCPSGRTNQRIKGWLGRADQTTKVRGMFVHPSQIAEVAKRHPEILRARLVVEGEMSADRMTLHIEVATPPENLPTRVAETLRDITKLRGNITLLPPNTLPNDGKVIEDARSYK